MHLSSPASCNKFESMAETFCEVFPEFDHFYGKSFACPLYIIKLKCTACFNSLPNDKNLDWSKFKALADDKINVT